MPDIRDASSSFPWPPAVYGASFLIAVALSYLAPLPFVAAELLPAARIVGLLIFVAAVGLAALAEREFRRAQTPALPTLPTRAIVSTGVYAWTRNPMYLGMTLGLAALALVLNSLWFILAALLAVYAVTRLAIEREERYLAGKFGADYAAYRARVRRWL
jgi:protein-S-isoprenylcysteine O-methyltransferase Ste14